MQAGFEGFKSVIRSWTKVAPGRKGAICALTVFAAAITFAPSSHSQSGAPATPATVTADVAASTPPPPRMRMMTKEQYINSLKYIFGPELRIEARFAPMRRIQGLLANGSSVAGSTTAQIEQFYRTGSLVAAAVVDSSHRDFLIPCKPKNENTSDTACATKFLASTGRLLFRKPLSKEKINAVVADANASAEKLNDFYLGLATALEGLLLSPDLLYITDTYEADPRNKGKFRLDSYSLAQRLSFFLWNAGPDDRMIRAAETGEISTPKGREKIVDMMLASPRLEAGTRAFFSDMLAFEDLDRIAKDTTIYPNFTTVTLTDAGEQTLRTIVDHLITQRKDYRDLYTTRETFMSQALAAIYGVSVPPGWTPYEFSEDSGRAGITSHVSFLAAHAHPGRSSATLRGKALRELLMCQQVPPPPPNVDFSAVENPDPSLKTARDRLTAHRTNPSCAGCHKITDPMGLALEQFDGAGVYRTTEHGTPIDSSGTLDGTNFEDSVGLSKIVRNIPALTSCLVNRIYSYGTGGPTTRDDAPMLAHLNQRFAEQDYRLPDLLKTIALSPTFAEVVPPAAKAGRAEQTANAEAKLARPAN
jgi:hypothetical protein